MVCSARLSRFRGALSVFVALVTLSASARDATGITVTREQYVRAESLLRDRVDGLMLNERVIPHWLPKSDRFWYLRETAQGHEFVLVDATTGRKQAAFDHVALAAALQAVTAQAVDPAKLPFADFDAVGGEVIEGLRVAISDVSYACKVKPVSCTIVPEKAKRDELLSPDGRLAAFSRDGNLWIRDLESRQERALTQDGMRNFGYGIYPDAWLAEFVPRRRGLRSLPPLESQWSPDSRHFIVSRSDQRHVAEYPFVESAPADGSFRPILHPARIALVGERQTTIEWFVIDIQTGSKRRLDFPYDKLLDLQQDMVAIRHTWWSPGNDRVYAVAFGANMQSAFLFEAELATGSVRTVIEEHLEPRADLNTTSYNPPNVRLTSDGKEAIWFSQRDGWGHLYLYDTRTGELKNRITSGAWLVRDIIHVDEARRRIYFTAGGREPGNPYYRYLYRVNFDGTGLMLLSPEPGDHLLSSPWNDVLQLDGAVGYEAISPSGDYAVYTSSPMSGPTRSVIRRTSDAKLIGTVEETDVSRLLAAGYRPPEEFVAKAADGASDVYGVMYKPLDFDPARKYPVIDHQYASPLTAVTPRSFIQAAAGVPGYGTPASTAHLGFIVIAVDGRGTTFRSRAFTQAGHGRLNVNGLDDHVAAIRQLAQIHPYMDVTRVGITGSSYGGWSALRAVLEFPDFFKASVAGVPPGSLQTMYTDYHWTAFQGSPVYHGGTALRPGKSDVPTNWTELDSAGQAARLKAKLMIVMGELDENVPPGSTLQLVSSLIKANKDFDLIYMPGASHRETNTPYVTRRMWDFFVRSLHGTEPPPYEIKPAAPLR